MKFSTLSICLITIILLYTNCTQSVDKAAAQTDTNQVVESILEEPQVDSTSTLASNEEASDLEMETEMESSQADGEIIEEQTEDSNETDETSNKTTANSEESNSPSNTTSSEPSESTLSTSYTKEEQPKPSKDNTPSKTVEKPKPKPEPKKTSNPLASYFQVTNQFLSQYVSGGLIAYSKIKKNTIAPLVEQIATADLSKSNSTEKQAFYINAYNVLVIKSLINNGIPSSPLDVLGFFDAKKHKVAGQNITLDQLEKGKLFGLKKDPRFHFVAVCGAKGCPQIEPFAYSASNLNAQLNSQTKKAINNSNFIRVKDDEQKVEISEIFKWYAGDFTQGGKSVLDYINQYRNTPIPSNYEVAYYPYDWKVNKR